MLPLLVNKDDYYNNISPALLAMLESTRLISSLSNAKCNFYRAVNGIFSKILNFASEEVILELITRKCMPILLYGLESCQLSNGDLHSLDFTHNRKLHEII